MEIGKKENFKFGESLNIWFCLFKYEQQRNLFALLDSHFCVLTFYNQMSLS